LKEDEHDTHSISFRLSQLEEQLRDNVLQLKNTATAIEKDFDKRISSISINGWRLPFLFILLILVGATIGIYLFYQKLKKMHML
jgi:F0F1-type ATP synthase assembly protein I